MMKRFLIGMVIVIAMVFGYMMGSNSNDKVVAEAQTKIETEVFTYQISSVNGDEISGTALDNISFDNTGIFLIQSDFDLNLGVGDVIKVTFEKGVHDNILDVEVVK